MFVEEFAQVCERTGGLSRMVGRLWGVLLIAEQEYLSTDELMVLTGASRGSISTAVRQLEGMGLVQRVTRAGDRRHYYRARDAAALIEDVGVAPDVIIADYVLDDGENGLDAIAALRSRHGVIPAVLVSADRSAELKLRAQAADVTLLHKPLELHRLRAVLQWVKNSSARA